MSTQSALIVCQTSAGSPSRRSPTLACGPPLRQARCIARRRVRSGRVGLAADQARPARLAWRNASKPSICMPDTATVEAFREVLHAQLGVVVVKVRLRVGDHATDRLNAAGVIGGGGVLKVGAPGSHGSRMQPQPDFRSTREGVSAGRRNGLPQGSCSSHAPSRGRLGESQRSSISSRRPLRSSPRSRAKRCGSV